MTYPETFGDERMLAFCALCGGETGTRDHVPARVLLDDPLPQMAAVVPACERCNNGMSTDEEYLACAVEVALKGTAESDTLRPKVRGILKHSPKLARRFALSFNDSLDLFGEAHNRHELSIDTERVRRVLIKIARGHAMHELHEPQDDEPTDVNFDPLHLMSDDRRQKFETPANAVTWPEVGSRAMQRLLAEGGLDWIEVQPDRYRFLAQTDGSVLVRMVFSEYLAAEVIWETQ
jgi:hypothetical protein